MTRIVKSSTTSNSEMITVIYGNHLTVHIFSRFIDYLDSIMIRAVRSVASRRSHLVRTLSASSDVTLDLSPEDFKGHCKSTHNVRFL